MKTILREQDKSSYIEQQPPSNIINYVLNNVALSSLNVALPR